MKIAVYLIDTGLVIASRGGDIVPPPMAGEAYLEIDEHAEVYPGYSTVLDGVLRNPPVAPVDDLRPVYSFNQWVDLFPLAEQVAIVTATMSDPLAKLIYDRAQSASGSIDPTDPRTLEGLSYLVAQGWVSQATFDRIAGA